MGPSSFGRLGFWRFPHCWATADRSSIGDPYSIAFLTNRAWWTHPHSVLSRSGAFFIPLSADPCVGAFLTTAPRRTHPPSSDPYSVVFRITGPRRTHISLLELYPGVFTVEGAEERVAVNGATLEGADEHAAANGVTGTPWRTRTRPPLTTARYRRT
ncbi:hypothetical protein Y032_0236g3225 [Ancylostoma ceylanicum]|uniref:Uncharacterized protein n=1 Tax=Ancylostoma ceylanicum TaxID=53326 RepID=A0A016SFP6_9BILA|nr:hypothetical protein Y032_0236g3225 [Ancylostoma ceylanicum]